MAVKSFVPQLVRLLVHICNYITKHRTVLNSYLTTSQEQDALNAVQAACTLLQGLVQLREEA